MNYETIHNASSVQIFYGSVPGCALKATILARQIEHCFQVPVGFESCDDRILDVVVNGLPIYRHEGPWDFQKGHDAIIADLARLMPQLRSMPDTDEGHPDADDPEHQQWMRHLCSGE